MHVEPKIDFHVGQNQPPNIKNSTLLRMCSLVLWLSKIRQSQILDSTPPLSMNRLSVEKSGLKE